MSEQMAIVIETGPDGVARILSDRKGGCGGCHPGSGGCQSCLTGAKMETRAANPLGAKAGDVVKVSIASREVFKGAAILYIMPVVALLAGAVGGDWFGARMGWPASAGAVAGALIGLIVALAVVVLLDRSSYAKRRLMPTITDVVTVGKR
jgi:sigma-E factor negative regulatory protein RseC